MTKINIPDCQLNNYLTHSCPAFSGAKKWIRIDVGDQETYVGDNTFIITVIKHKPMNVDEMNSNCNKIQPIVIRYLQSEGFIDKEYIYIGLQEIDLQDPPDGLTYEE
jgi:hypothetical protein